MKKKAFLIFTMLLLGFGCVHKQVYVEGTHIVLGAYFPTEDSLYGVELMQYTSGAYLATSTNVSVKFKRDYAATNSFFWGMVETTERSKSKFSTRP
jgi:hypothetical protein